VDKQHNVLWEPSHHICSRVDLAATPFDSLLRHSRSGVPGNRLLTPAIVEPGDKTVILASFKLFGGGGDPLCLLPVL
jgi:hypothetical protein